MFLGANSGIWHIERKYFPTELSLSCVVDLDFIFSYVQAYHNDRFGDRTLTWFHAEVLTYYTILIWRKGCLT